MEARLFAEGTIPECATPEWYAGRDRAPHVDESLHRPRLDKAAEFVRWIADELNLSTVSDLGAGDGGLLSLLGDDPLQCWGYDLQPSNVDGAHERGVDVELADVFADPIIIGDIVVCTEMLEHLVDPHGWVARLWNTPAIAIVASSPWTETAEFHYEFHLWAWDLEGYHELFARSGWKIERHQGVGMFQVLLAVRS